VRRGVGTTRQGPYAPVALRGHVDRLRPRAVLAHTEPRSCDVDDDPTGEPPGLVTLGGRAWRFPRRTEQPVMRLYRLPDEHDHDLTVLAVPSSTMMSTTV